MPLFTVSKEEKNTFFPFEYLNRISLTKVIKQIGDTGEILVLHTLIVKFLKSRLYSYAKKISYMYMSR